MLSSPPVIQEREEPETNFSLSCIKFGCQVSVFSRNPMYGETRIRTKLRIVSKWKSNRDSQSVDVTRLLTPLPVARRLIPVTLLYNLISLLPDLTCAHFITLQTHSRLAQGWRALKNVSDHRLHRNMVAERVMNALSPLYVGNCRGNQHCSSGADL